MVLYGTDSTTGEPTLIFATANRLLTSGGGGGGGVSKTSSNITITVGANSLSTEKIDCSSHTNIRVYGDSTIVNSINLSFSNDDIDYKNVMDNIYKISVNGVNTFSLELTNIPNYIKFYNDNGISDTINLYYVLF
tara:strand:+ start:249 stop:653 length:405 start_codon:yes stop_codon:yes gene_type:complete